MSGPRVGLFVSCLADLMRLEQAGCTVVAPSGSGGDTVIRRVPLAGGWARYRDTPAPWRRGEW